MDDLAFAGAARQADLVRRGEVSSRQLTQLSLDRIARHDPTLNSFRIVFAEGALAEADAADARRERNEDGPLLGVPMAVKDDTDVRGAVTAKGSIAHGGPAADDAEIVARLRRAGAVIVGKTNVPELMTMPFTETLWYGVTRNPWDLDRVPGGSSGGSAAAVAAGLVAAATGSDGAGSIRIPAACTGLVGLKCGPGVIPTPPSWNGLSTNGFLTRTVTDAVLLHGVGGGVDTAEAPGRLRVGWSAKIPPGALGKPDEIMRGALRSMTRTLEGLGHEVFEKDPDLGLAGVNLVARYLRGIADDARSMAHPDRLDRRSRGMARMGSLIPEPLLERALRAAREDRDRISAIFQDADFLVMPVFNELPPRIGDYEGKGAVASLRGVFGFTPFPGLFNHTGLPAISLPADRTEAGFPLGVQIIGPLGSEPRLLALAAQLEGELAWPDRRPPGFLE